MREGKPRMVFALAGVGLGNATRCHAIAERLPHVDIHILAFGNAARYFGKRGYQVHRLLPMILPGSWVSYLWAIPLNIVAFFANVLLSFCWLLKLWPQAILVDSEYSSILPGLLFRRPLIGLNNASVVCALWKRFGSPDLRVSYWTREVWDARICSLFTRTLVPAFDLDVPLPPGHVAISPIVRSLPESTSTDGPLLVLRGGSEHLTPLEIPPGLTVEEVGGANPVDDSLERIARASAVICQGGFSSLSEVLALGKVAIAAPLPGHAEQCLNVRLLEEQGSLLSLESETLAEALESRASFTPQPGAMRFHGAQDAAEMLRSYLHVSPREPLPSIDETSKAQ